jgi:hypothetical protein
MDDEPWQVRRRRELEAAAPAKRKKTEPFVKVPFWFAVSAARATRSPAMIVCVELLRASWKARSATFPVANIRLGELGVGREVKRRVLRDLERAGLVTVERPLRRAPIVTLLGL